MAEHEIPMERDIDEGFYLNSNEEEHMNTDPCCSVDVDMISSKLSYFFQNAKDSCYLPYMILFLTGVGLSSTQAGMVNGLRFLGFIVGAPLWGILADYKQIHRLVILILCISSFCLISLQPFLSIPMTEKKICDRMDNQTSNLTLLNSTASVDTDSRTGGTASTLFATLMVINLLASCFDGSTQGFVDSGVIQKINTKRKKVEFGRQRLFGAVGYGVGAFASSLAVEYFPKSYLPCYTPVFIVYGCLMLCLATSTYSLFNDLSFSSGSRKERTESITSDIHRRDVNVGILLRKTVCGFNALFFLATVLVTGTIHALYIGFLFILLKEINCPNIVMGISIVVGALASAICISLSANFIKLFGGTIRTLCVGCLSWAIRFLLFTYLENPWLVLIVQVLQGPGYGLFIATSVVHIKMISSPSIYTSMYGIFNGLFFGAGAVLGNVIGGTLLMKFGIRSLFLGTSIAGFVWTFIMIIYLFTQFYQKKKKNAKEMRTEEVQLSQNI